MDAVKVKEAIAAVPCAGGLVAHRGRTVGECLPAGVLDAIAAAAVRLASEASRARTEPEAPHHPGPGEA